MISDLHSKLILKQDVVELYRKKVKASRKAFWTQEDVDFSNKLASLKGRDFEIAYKEITGIDLSGLFENWDDE